ncbi:MAG: DUF6020 family protein [Lachnospiraceae bacterium]|nr:DUF6020 family protein [Lachnospiraceae bacterium]
MSEQTKKISNIHIPDKVVLVLLAWFGAVGVNGTIAFKGDQIPYTNSFLAFVIFFLNLFVLKLCIGEYRNLSIKEKICPLVFSLLTSFSLHMGASLEKAENVDFKNAGLYIFSLLLALFLAPVVFFIWNKLPAFLKRSFFKDEAKGFKYIHVWMMLFILWLPVFFAFFPGAFVYDATEEYTEVISRAFTMHHPLLHVLILGGIVHLAEYLGMDANVGIAVYTVCQMAVFSAVLSYLIMWLGKRGMSKRFLLCTLLFFGLFPIFPMYAVCSAKDTLFTAAFLLVVLLLVDRLISGEEFYKSKKIAFVVASFIMMLLRNNGFYAYLACMVIMAVVGLIRKEDKKQLSRLMILMLLSMILYLGGSRCLMLACHASDDEHQEMLTVPIQQLARVYKYSPESFSQDELITLYEILPHDHLITYNSRISDVLKSGFDNHAYESDPGKYRKLWWSIAKKKPYIYLNAWLANSYGYWYPDMVINVYGGNEMYTFTYKDSSYFGFETEPPGHRVSLFPLLERFYKNISLELFQQRIPVISMFFAPGFVFYIFALHFFGLIKRKRIKLMAAYSPVLMLWATVLLGPTILVRYVLILWCIIPLLIYTCGESDEYSFN